MIRRLCSLLLIACSLSPFMLQAGEEIVTEFRPGSPQGREVLAHVPVKVLIAEFIDPQASGLGKSLGYMLWREALTAVHDQRGAGIIYAHTAGDIPLTNLLRQDYHLAAQEIARSQKSRIVMWGAVAEERGKVYIDSYLTLLPELIGESLTLTLESEGRPLPGFTTEISRSRYGFNQVRYPRERLFQRRVITRVDTRLRQRPSREAAVLTSLSAGTALQALDMHADWFQVVLDDGRTGWLNIGQLDIPPRSARIDGKRINVRSGPGQGHAVLRMMNLHGEYPLLDRRFVAGEGVWYRLRFPWGEGWVAASLTRPRFTLPAIQFMAGLQRYQLKNYGEAAAAFGRFVEESGERGSNVNLAAALALRGSSLLMSNVSSREARKAIMRAVALTPYDPLIYNLRMLSTLYAHGLFTTERSAQMVDDLERSLELAPRNPRTQTLLQALVALSRMQEPEYKALRHSFRMEAATRERLEDLRQSYLEAQRP